MRAAQMVAPGRLETVEVPIPEPGEGEDLEEGPPEEEPSDEEPSDEDDASSDDPSDDEE